MLKPIEDFIKNITSIDDPDYGDFMGKANFYLSDLAFRLRGYKAVDDEISQMKEYLQYLPHWQVEETRKRLLKDANFINTMIESSFNKIAA